MFLSVIGSASPSSMWMFFWRFRKGSSDGPQLVSGQSVDVAQLGRPRHRDLTYRCRGHCVCLLTVSLRLATGETSLEVFAADGENEERSLGEINGVKYVFR